MKKITQISFVVVVCLALVGFVSAQKMSSKKLITSNSVGDVKIGMKVAEARKALKGYNLERTSDGEGVALIGVNRDGSEYIMTIYAGEEDTEVKIDENAKIEMIEVWFSDHMTAEGVHPRMKISDVEKKYGKVKEILMSPIESREYATFAKQPRGLQFRLLGEGMDAGKYKKGENKTNSYTTGAYLHSILIWGTDTN